ncbi:MAG: glycosyltransferase family 39 protein [Parcubacteria group bacterium]
MKNPSASATEEKNKKIPVYILLSLIVALGLFLRAYHIDTVPPGIYPDEAVNGQDAIRALETGEFQWFYPANQGREGLFMNLVALCFKFFGISILTLKLPAIIFGTLAILGTYLLAKELFQKERIGLIAAFLYATSFWAINFSRISFRANMLPFILVFTFYFLFKAVHTKKFSYFAASGFIFGIGVHTYIAFRIAPLILIALLFSFILSQKKFLREYWKHIAIFTALMLLSAFPMLYTFYAHPEFFESRSDSVSVFSPALNHGHPFLTLFESFGLSLAKFNFWGDQNWRHNYPPYPVLDPLVGIAFLFGMIYSASTLLHLLIRRIKHRKMDARINVHLLLIAWFFIMLAPEFMTAEGLPHALRSIGSLPPVIIFAAITFEYFLEKSQKNSKFYKKIVASIAILMLVSIGLFNSVKYHYFWAHKEKVGMSFNKNLTDIAKYIKTRPPQEEKFVITSYNTLEKAPIEVLIHPNNTSFIFPDRLSEVNPRDSRNFMIFFTEYNRDAIWEMRQRFPDLVFAEVDNSLGSVYYILK